MRVLVFGATGQVARGLAQIAPDMTFLPRDRADLTDPDACAEIILQEQSDVIINAAAYTAVDAAETDHKTAQLVNAAAPGAMARAAAARGIPFVHISTDYVFDGQGHAPWRPQDQTGPLGVYGQTKLEGEQAVQTAGGAHAILRTSWVFSQWGRNFVTTMLRLGAERDHLTIVGDQTGGPTWAVDIAGACIEIADQLRKNKEKSGVYHYSGAPDVTWADFARAIFHTAGQRVTVTDITTADFPTPARRPPNSRLDGSDTTAVFGLEDPDWQAALRTVIEACQRTG